MTQPMWPLATPSNFPPVENVPTLTSEEYVVVGIIAIIGIACLACYPIFQRLRKRIKK